MLEPMSICLIPHSALVFLVLLFGLLAVGQTIIFGFRLLQRNRGTQRIALVAEINLLLFFLMNFALCWALAKGFSAPYIGGGLDWINIAPSFWLCLFFFVVSIAAGFADKLPHLVVDGACTLIVAPCFLDVQSPLWCGAYVLCTLYFVGRTTFVMTQAWLNRHKHLSYFASIEALNNLPEGILVYDEKGAIELLNEAMRTCLSALSFSTDLSDAHVLADTLQSYGDRIPLNGTPHSRCVRVDMPDGTVRLFVFAKIEVKQQPHDLIIALDVTEEEHLRRDTEKTNRELGNTRNDLLQSLENVQAVAENDALLFLQSRVHDIIGQRLSILHRYLEDGAQSEESFAQIQPLLNSILDDLEPGETSDSKTELYAIVYAFSLIAVAVEIQGELPEDSAISLAFVQVVREACTNAVKHGQASHVWIVLDETPEEYMLFISNDGEEFTGDLHQGKGLPGMARAIVSVGGQLTLQPEKNFALRASVPRTSTSL